LVSASYTRHAHEEGGEEWTSIRSLRIRRPHEAWARRAASPLGSKDSADGSKWVNTVNGDLMLRASAAAVGWMSSQTGISRIEPIRGMESLYLWPLEPITFIRSIPPRKRAGRLLGNCSPGRRTSAHDACAGVLSRCQTIGCSRSPSFRPAVPEWDSEHTGLLSEDT
jgi:hypothetical protein